MRRSPARPTASASERARESGAAPAQCANQTLANSRRFSTTLAARWSRSPGTFLVTLPPAVTDETFFISARAPSRTPNLYVAGEDEGTFPAQVWNGLLGEFRNRLARLNAGTVQVRDALPLDIGADLAPTLADMDANLDGLAGLVSCLG